jgi:hypothetical protein
MINIFDKKIGHTLHHAYFIEGEPVQTEQALKDFLSSRGVDIHNNILIESYESLNIEKALLLKSYQSERSSNGTDKYIIVKANGINHEAENALLKMLEEPTEGTYLFFILPKVDILNGTLRSRAHIIHTDFITSDSFATNFLKQNIGDRIKSIAEVVAIHKDAETSGPLREHAVQILDQLEKLMHDKDGRVSKDSIFKYQEILKARQNLALPGSAVKMILEHIALVI